MQLSSLRLLLAAPLLALAAPATASDGARQINQACAVQTGCFTGDTAGYPVTITASGSYVLTGNLVVPDASTHGIYVTAPRVHIDLNGFEIVRSGCEGAVVNCAPPAGGGAGIAFASSGWEGVSVENGSVTGMGRGVILGQQARATNMRVRWNAGDGITAYVGSTVSGCAAFENGGIGIYVGQGSTASDNVAQGNSGEGIHAEDGSVVSANAARQNGSSGIYADVGATVSGNSANDNGGDGIVASNGSIVSGNAAWGNGNHGIRALSGTSVLGNNVRVNQDYGLYLASDVPYRENTITNNWDGPLLGGVNRGDNYCEGAGAVSNTCP